MVLGRAAVAALGFAAFAALAGCQTVTARAECRDLDWSQRGFADGAEGRPSAAFEALARDCATAGVAPDAAAYQAGHARGLGLFCTFRRGYDEARAERSDSGICTGRGAAYFESGYGLGAEVSRLERRREALESEAAAARARALDPERSSNERALANAEATRLASEIFLVQSRQRQLEKEADRRFAEETARLQAARDTAL
jgi:hypothetical protein